MGKFEQQVLCLRWEGEECFVAFLMYVSSLSSISCNVIPNRVQTM